MHGYGTGQKYNNQKIVYKGAVYDSKKELNRWLELQALEQAGKITDLKRQVRFNLIPAQNGKHRHERPCVYNADFVYLRDGEQVVEDAKGAKTAEYIMKRKMMLFIHGISVMET